MSEKTCPTCHGPLLTIDGEARPHQLEECVRYLGALMDGTFSDEGVDRLADKIANKIGRDRKLEP